MKNKLVDTDLYYEGDKDKENKALPNLALLDLQDDEKEILQ